MGCVVLTYHSHNVFGTEYGNNDHVALPSDLRTIAECGGRIVPLREIAGLLAARKLPRDELLVGLSFDDGPIFDVRDFTHRELGLQRGFVPIMKEFASETGHAVHATSFVIASPEARKAMELSEDCGYTYLRDWLDDGWWKEASDSGLLEIGNHSWDHVHSAVERTALTMSSARNDFTVVHDYADADREIRVASDRITEICGRPCEMFAYPFGHSNSYLEEDYLPGHIAEHRATAAFGAQGRAVQAGDSVWNIPRLICGHHWKSTAELKAFLRS